MKLEVSGLLSRSAKRVVINPNRATKKSPSWTVLGFEEFDVLPSVGDRLVAVQPDDDGDWLSTARVTEVDADNQLVYADVDWGSFALEGTAPRTNYGSQYTTSTVRSATSSPVHYASSFEPLAA